MSVPLETLLADDRVKLLINAARHAHAALTFDAALRAQRRAADNLELALDVFSDGEHEHDTLPCLPTYAGRP